MIRNKRYLLILLTFLSFSSACRQASMADKEKGQILQIVEKLKVKDDIKWVVILPGLGCGGCIEEAELFMKENVNKKNVLFVLTKLESVKVLQSKINVRIRDYKNIYIDKDNELMLSSNNVIYPCIVTVKKGKMVTYHFQSPKNNQAFNSLRLQLSKA